MENNYLKLLILQEELKKNNQLLSFDFCFVK